MATLAAIGVLVYVIKNVVHEGLGHGGVCLLVGGEPVAISSAWWDGTYDGVSDWGVRWVAAGGTFANLILAGALLALWRPTHRLRSDRSAFGYFIWLLIVANLLSGGGYMMVDPIGGFGDWTKFSEGLQPTWLWRVVISAAGVAVSGLALLFGRRTIGAFLGSDTTGRGARIRALCWTPYFAGGILFVLAAALNPGGYRFMFTSALATFGGTAWLAWFLPFIVPAPNADQPDALGVGKSWAWMFVGGVAAAFTLSVLGPSVRF